MVKSLIKKAPYWIQLPIRKIYGMIPYEKKLDQDFYKMYNFLQESQWWTEKKHKEYQISELKKLINHAYENVPYYRKVFNERGLKPNDIKDFDNLKKLPYLTKEKVKNNLDDLIAVNYNKDELVYKTTGGSTGEPMAFFEEKKVSKEREWAFIVNLWSRVGYEPAKRNKLVKLCGDKPLKGIYQDRGLDLILSSYHLTEKNMKKYIQLIEDFDPDFIKAYPSSIYILSDYILDNNIDVKLGKLKSVLCASENIYDFQREKIKEAFQTRVYSFYGHTEHCCLAGECEESDFYHLNSEYGYTELINENGQEVTKEDEVGEIVCTGFNNYVVPFIRYKTKDLAVNTNQRCECGRNYKLIKRVKGREQEYILTKRKRKIMLTGSYKILDKVKQHIEIGQFYQDEPGILELRLVKKSSYSSSEIEYIINKFKEKFDNQIELKVRFVENIPRTESGKHKFLIQKILD
ncbi:hypothetical protein MWH25_07995 [Natroniella acetigena]|uniref:phenylacetate--CoA ligase family protein n=1 Tax=Natroniella acetigena TaxID=52004 RepID=UPI00200B2FAD|nr:hypothetical protein [Natroniella acetigena]MCK8827683.1 hypothetical protein [Natroniella acetigena]